MSKKDLFLVTAFMCPWMAGVVSTWIPVSLIGVLIVSSMAWFSFAISSWAWRKSNG